MTRQPIWQLHKHLGDVALERGNVDYGGMLLYMDATGMYPPELEVLDSPEDDRGGDKYIVYRFILDKCFWTESDPENEPGKFILSDNKYHLGLSAWFADKLAGVADSCGIPLADLRALLCSDDPLQRATGYIFLGGSFGWHEFDHDPLYLTRTEAERRYRYGGRKRRVRLDAASQATA